MAAKKTQKYAYFRGFLAVGGGLRAWVGVVKKCGARTAATRVSVSGNLGDLFDIVFKKKKGGSDSKEDIF